MIRFFINIITIICIYQKMSEERISKYDKQIIDDVFNLKRIFFLCHIDTNDIINSKYNVPIFSVQPDTSHSNDITTHSKYEDRIKYYILYLCKNNINIFWNEREFIKIKLERFIL